MIRNLSVPQKHQRKIAIQTLKMHDAAVGIMGGMTKEEARSFLIQIGEGRIIERIEGYDEARSNLP